MIRLRFNVQRVSCLVELTTGTALLLTPGLAMTLIVGLSMPNGGNQIAQLFGAAIICLGLSCWSNKQATSQDEIPSISLTTYNILSGLLLATFSFSGSAKEIGALPAAVLHIPLGIALLRQQIKGDVDSWTQRSAAQRKPM